jgi:hypothetical protein
MARRWIRRLEDHNIQAVPTASVDVSHRVASACGALALVTCLAVIQATPNDAFWTVDAGSKALLAQRLLDSGYAELAFEHPAIQVDPQGHAFPIPPPYAVARDGGFVSQYPVAYPALAAPFAAVLGGAGLRVPAALGVSACAYLFVLWLTPAVGRGWAGAGGAALALATPLFFYGVTVWEHSLTAALSLGAWLALTRRSRARLLAAGLLIGIACWLRTELALMGIALAFACWIRDRQPADAAWLAAGALPAATMLLVFNALAYGDPLGPHVLGNVGAASGPLAPGVLLARASALLGAFGGNAAEGAALGVLTLSCLVAGAAAARRERATVVVTGLALAIGVTVSLYGAFQTASARVPWIVLAHYNGLAVRMPAICLAGLGAARVWQRSEYASLRLGVVAGLGFLLLASIFRIGFTDFMAGGHWGPRMLLPAVPALAALALAALHAEVCQASPPRARALLAGALALALAGLVSTGVSIRLLDAQKREGRRLQRTLLDAPQPFLVTDYSPLAQQLAGLWGRKPLLLTSSPASFARIVEGLSEAGIESFLWVQRSAGSDVVAPGAHCSRVETYRGRDAPWVLDVELHACRVRSRAPR